MATSIAFHSHKGGSGKTLFAMNFAAYLAKIGKRVAVLDLDLSAPSLGTYFPGHTGKKINNYLLDQTPPSEVFFDATNIIGENVDGKLFMALADDSAEAIAKINQRDMDALLNDLFMLMELVRNVLPEDPFNVDYVIIDTSPGLTTHAINGVAITDHVVLLLRLVNADVEGTKHFLETLYKTVQPRASLIINQIAEHIIAEGGREKISSLVNSQIINRITAGKVELAGILGTDKQIITNEFNFAMEAMTRVDKAPRPIHFLNPNSQAFADKFANIAKGLLDV